MVALSADRAIVSAKVAVFLSPNRRTTGGTRRRVCLPELMVGILVQSEPQLAYSRNMIDVRLVVEVGGAQPYPEVKADLHRVVHGRAELNLLIEKTGCLV